MTSEKGLLWASDYWSANVYQQASNSINNDGDPYGAKGDARWQQIALSEGWANYREWKLAKDYLGWNSISALPWIEAPYYPSNYTDTSLGFPVYYTKIFEKLQGIGISSANIESSLSTYSVGGFKENLKSRYPVLTTQIEQIIVPYE